MKLLKGPDEVLFHEGAFCLLEKMLNMDYK